MSTHRAPSGEASATSADEPHASSSLPKAESSAEGSSGSSSDAVPRRGARTRKAMGSSQEESSNSSRLSMMSWRWSTWSDNIRQQRRRGSAALSFLFGNKRQTYPPCARVLKQERRRFTHPKKSHSSANRQRQRHSIGTYMSSFKSNKTQPSQPSVRSSMILQLSEEDIEVLYDDPSPAHSSLGSLSSLSSCRRCQPHFRCIKHRRHTEPIPPLPTGPWPRRRLRGDKSWFYSWVQDHPRHKKTLKTPHVTPSPEPIFEPLSSFLHPPTISSISCTTAPSVPAIEHPVRFSAFWFDTHGQSGKHRVRVDEKGRISFVRSHSLAQTLRAKSSGWYQHHATPAQGSLFMFGFLLFPLWWTGAWLYLRHTSTHATLSRDVDLQVSSLATSRTLGQLNCWMSALSLLIIMFIVAMAIWYTTVR